MSLLDKILAWATADLTLWQRDALRRLLQKQELAQPDYEDLYAMLKSARGLPDPTKRQPDPLAQHHLPVQVAIAAPVVLLAMRDLKHVNRISHGQKLPFAPKGMTVIYGGNAAGKSGYSRVLKQACRARDSLETVHPDAFDAKAVASIPEATFEIEIGGHASSVDWKRGVAAPDALSTIAVFDSKCARAYLDEGDVAYLPYGLDIVENLGQRVLPELIQRLNAEISTTNTDSAPFADLLGDTAVGQLIASLGPDTNPLNVTALATLSAADTNRLAELDKTLTESDPTAKAKTLRLSAQRVDGLILRIDAAFTWVNDAVVEKLQGYDIEAEAASKAEIVAAEGFRGGAPLLPGTGEQVWKILFEAARRYSTEIAYPGEPFPFLGPNAQCPLCQQPMDQKAGERMRRFEDFVKQDAAKIASEKREQREKAAHKILAASLSFGLDAAMAEELRQLDTALLQTTLDFEKKVDTRKVWLLDALKTHAWDNVPTLQFDPRPDLKLLSAKIGAQADDLDKAGDEQQKKALETERTELRARTNLSLRLQAILDLVQRMKTKAMLTKCKDDLKTRGISEKAKDLASQAVTAALKSALDAEFQALGVGHIKTKLNERVEKSKMKHKLVLDLPITTRLDEILSEGEQRAIAIGSFLAELHLAGHKSGIVFDDPVSSLDHHWRKNVAKRLVEEAKVRQVIVLTHDTVFLGELLDHIEQDNVDNLMHHLEWVNGRPGHVSEGLPWDHKPYKDRLDKLESEQTALEKSWPTYPNNDESAKMRQQYNHLRATIERMIEEIVFSGAVKRYRDWVKVNKLGDVVGFTQVEYDEIDRLHKACCDVVDAHDPSSAKNAPVPNAKQLGKDISDLRLVTEAIRTRRKKAASAALSSPAP